MIAAIASWLFAAATPITAAPAPKPYHVYEVKAPPQPSVFRVRLSDDVAKSWAIEQIQYVSVYDRLGTKLGCEQLSRSLLGTTTKSYPLTGTWGDVEKGSVPQRSVYGPLNSSWRFGMPAFAENERPVYLRFDWRSNVSNPGAVRLVEIPSGNGQNGRVETHLMDGQSDPTHGHARIYLESQQPKVWAPGAELLFTVSQGELTLESPTLDTLTAKPWTLTTAGGPGWILFKGDGIPPYRLQLGEVIYGCDGMNMINEQAPNDPDWPPEVFLGSELLNAQHMGQTPDDWQREREAQTPVRQHVEWLGWSIWTAVLFAVAFFIAVLPARR